MESVFSLSDIQTKISEMKLVNTKREIDTLAQQSRDILSSLLEGGHVVVDSYESHMKYVDYWAEQSFIDLGYSDSENCYKESI